MAVVAMGGIVAIASPDSLNAVDRAKQRRSMAAIRSIGAAIEAYSVDNYIYPIAPTMAQLRPLIEPRYIKAMPMVDGWGNPFQIDASGSQYTLFSQGKDGAGTTCVAATTTLFIDQICWVNGGFTRYPVGPQQ